ncbi:MAG: T9SS type A sorting domain-containing protein [Candidatus Latescibacteria bacterium]|nr:T9SS type A sorting domain-containing protein [Candidatus Latescibacterota bacterium]
MSQTNKLKPQINTDGRIAKRQQHGLKKKNLENNLLNPCNPAPFISIGSLPVLRVRPAQRCGTGPWLNNKGQKYHINSSNSCLLKLCIAIAIIQFSLSYAAIPLSSSPSWTSIDNDYSTGGGFADINNNGFIDFCTSNGNDMALNKQAIYYNNNGVLETQASWRSSDSGMFGHLYLGDVNNDGHLDMAVAFLGPQGDCKTRIYYNTGNSLSVLPTWISADTDSSFDCAFGDVDLDGDLDLAVSAGDAYANRKSPTKIYRNHNGVFEPLPYWTADDSTPSDAVRFADLDNDGYLDLVVGYRGKLSVFYNQAGIIETTASWSINISTWVLRLALADYDNDGWIDLAIAANGQLGSDSSYIKVFKNNQGQLNTFPSFTMRRNTQYCSAVCWADFNNDGFMDLAAGGWWEALVVFENRNGVLDTLPTWSWTSGTNLVSEAIITGDVRNRHLICRSDTFISNGTRKLFSTRKSPMQKLINVQINNNPIPLNAFCYDPLAGWVSINASFIIGDTVIINYTYAQYPDLAVTNWTRTIGNYLFYNTTPQAIEQTLTDNSPRLFKLSATPNPFHNHIQFNILIDNAMINIYNAGGMKVKTLKSPPYLWNGRDENGREIPNGIYFAEVLHNNAVTTEKIVKLN